MDLVEIVDDLPAGCIKQHFRTETVLALLKEITSLTCIDYLCNTTAMFGNK